MRVSDSRPENASKLPRSSAASLFKHIFGVLVSLGVSAVILLAIVQWKEIRLGALARHWQGADKGLLAAAFLLSVTFHLLFGSHKLWLVLRAMGVAISLRDTVKVVLGIGPLQLLLPLKGGEVVAMLYLWRHQRAPLGSASSGVIIDRALNFLAAALWLLLGLSLHPDASLAGYTSGLVSGGAVLLVALFATPLHDTGIALAGRLHPRLGAMARAVLDPWRLLPTSQRLLLLGYGMVVVMRPILVCALLFVAFGQQLVVGQVLVYAGLAIFAGHLPGPLMGMGAREGVLVGVAGFYAGDPAVALSLGILLSMLVYIGPMLVGLPWLPALLHGVAAGQKRAAAEDAGSCGGPRRTPESEHVHE